MPHTLLLAAITLCAVLAACGSPEHASHHAAPGAPAQDHVEVAEVMGHVQRYHQKLWASASAGNAELAAFYLHELEEVMEEVAEGNVVDDGVDISTPMKAFGLATLATLEAKLKQEGVAALHATLPQMVDACNQCHQQCGYPFVRIRVPEQIDFPDQDFSPAP